jgi:putative transcriptional regulator
MELVPVPKPRQNRRRTTDKQARAPRQAPLQDIGAGNPRFRAWRLEPAPLKIDPMGMDDRDPPDVGEGSPGAPAFLTGRALIAMPGIEDPRFERAVVLICAHTAEMAMGLTLNRPLDGLTATDLLERLNVHPADDLPEDLVLLGGPVERERGFVLHTDDYLSAGSSTKVAEGIALTGTREVLEAVAGRIQRPRRSILALGYAGWGPGQLEREIRESVWLTCDPDEALLFGHDYEHKWSMALARIGVSAEQLSTQGGRA